MMTENRRFATEIAVFIFILLSVGAARSEAVNWKRIRVKKAPSSRTEINLEEIPYQILFESYRRTEGKHNWELCQINADGSNLINITSTPNLNEMYGHASPDGKRICFITDEGLGRRKVRNVYFMNIDGTERVKIARNARQPCWSPDGKKIAYLKGEYERYSSREYATSELYFYDIETKQHKPHVNKTLHHVYAINWVPDSNWFLGVVHGGMGFSDTILAIEVNGTRVFDLARWGVKGCRPNASVDGTMMTWGETDWDLCVADLDLTGNTPVVRDVTKVVGCRRDEKVYHVDLSPDKKYIVFSYGPWAGGQQVGGLARNWNLCISDLSGKWVKITTDGLHYKEPDWIPVPRTKFVVKGD